MFLRILLVHVFGISLLLNFQLHVTLLYALIVPELTLHTVFGNKEVDSYFVSECMPIANEHLLQVLCPK